MLALMLVLVGASKWLMGAPAQAVVPIDVAKAIGVLELIAGVAFVARPLRRCICIGVIVICLSGIAIHFAYPDRPCGCLGPVSPGWHLFVTGVLGFLSTTQLSHLARSASASRAPC